MGSLCEDEQEQGDQEHQSQAGESQDVVSNQQNGPGVAQHQRFWIPMLIFLSYNMNQTCCI